MGTQLFKDSSSTVIKLVISIRYFPFSLKMKISYSCLIVAVVIGLGTVTAAPVDDVKAVAADAAKLASLAREAADGGWGTMCDPSFCRHCCLCGIKCGNCKACE